MGGNLLAQARRTCSNTQPTDIIKETSHDLDALERYTTKLRQSCLQTSSCLTMLFSTPVAFGKVVCSTWIQLEGQIKYPSRSYSSPNNGNSRIASTLLSGVRTALTAFMLPINLLSIHSEMYIIRKGKYEAES